MSGPQHGDNIASREVLILFDVDGTLTKPRLVMDEFMDNYLRDLRKRVTIGLVGGSDLDKIAEQATPLSARPSCANLVEACINKFDYVFAENGLVAYKQGSLMGKQSLLNQLGEDKLQTFINFCLSYMSNLRLPAKRGNFIEFRNGMINVCPVGRSCSQLEREQFNAYDREHNIRRKFVEELERRFGEQGDEPLGLVYAIGGQISFDAYPKGWDKTFCLNLIDERHKVIYFFGDQTSPGGNDHAIYADPRTIGRTVKSPEDTLEQLKSLNF